MDYEIKLNSFYLCVKDIKRAIDFYKQILNRQPENGEPMFVVNGIRFWLFDYQAANDNRVILGHNCLPSFEVSDINAFIEKLKQLQAPLVYPLTRLGNNWVLEFKDSEGNDIEAYSKWCSPDEIPDENYKFN